MIYIFIHYNDWVSTTKLSNGSKLKYYPVFVNNGYPLNSKGEITVTLPALESGFSYDSYKVYESRVNVSRNSNLLRFKTTISGTTMTCTYILTTTGAAAANAGDVYTGFMLIAYKKVQ